MKTTWVQLITGTLLICASHSIARAAEDDLLPPPPPTNRPDPAALRERARNLAPEERQKLVREFREKHGLGTSNRVDWEKRREEFKQLPPAEREAKMKELRKEVQEARDRFKLISDDEREIKRREMKERIDAQVSDLKQKKTDGTITEAESRRLERFQKMSVRLEKGDVLGPRSPSAKRPAPNAKSAAPSKSPAEIK